MLSSGAGAFGVSSAMNQPPGFSDSPEGTSPDQGRNRRAKVRGLLKPLRTRALRSGPTSIRLPRASFVRLNDQTCGRIDLGQRGDLKPRKEPPPALCPRSALSEARGVRKFPRSRQDEDLNATPQRADFREHSIRLPTSPGNPLMTRAFIDPVVPTFCCLPHPLTQRRDDRF